MSEASSFATARSQLQKAQSGGVRCFPEVRLAYLDHLAVH